MTDDAADPVLRRRDRWRRIAASTQRTGYACFAVAIVSFFTGLITGFEGPIVTVIIIAMIAGSVALASGIQVQYAIRGAERHEDEARAQRRRR